jgi:CBS domain-containing protein
MGADLMKVFRILYRLFRAVSGSSSVEYALILGIVVTALCAGAVIVGEQTSRAMRAVNGSVLLAQSHEDNVGQSPENPGISVNAETFLRSNPNKNQQLLFLAIAAALIATICYAIKLRRGLTKHQEFHTVSISAEGRQTAENKKFAKRQLILQTLENELPSLFGNGMEVRQLMTHPVKHTLPTARISDVWKSMKQDDVRHYPVCDDSGKLVGILSDRDILANDSKFVSQCMTTDVCTVRPDTKVSPAVTMMIEQSISSLPVVDQGKLVGLLTMTDIAMTLQCALQILDKAEPGFNLSPASSTVTL